MRISVIEDEKRKKKRGQPPMEDELKILKVEYLSNNLLDHTQVLNVRLHDKAIIYKYFQLIDIQWKPTPKY